MSFVRDIFVEVATFLLKYSSNNFIKLFIFFKLGNQVCLVEQIIYIMSSNESILEQDCHLFVKANSRMKYWYKKIFKEHLYIKSWLPPVCKKKSILEYSYQN